MSAIYWRVEWHDRDVLAEPMLSTGWAGIDGAEPTTEIGLSACQSAKALLLYFGSWVATVRAAEENMPYDPECPRSSRMTSAQEAEVLRRAHRCPGQHTRIVAIEAEMIGTDQDGCPLVRPTRIVAETTYGEIDAHPAIEYLDRATPETVARLLAARTGRGNDPDDRDTYRIGPTLVRMTPAQADRWNRGDTTPEDEASVLVYDCQRDWYIPLGLALDTEAFGLEGEEATIQE